MPHSTERDVRPAKVQQKISGRLRSEQATRHRYAIRGYISTAAKRGVSVFTALHDALTGDPWMPPIPPPAEIRPQAITPRDESERSA
jgi:transposase